MTKKGRGWRNGVFYHFTSTYHLPLILESGFLKTVESNVGAPPSPPGVTPMMPVGDHVGPDVVWLLDTPDLGDHEHGIITRTTGLRKTEVRITVQTRADRWLTWAPGLRANRLWRATMIHSGGGVGAARHWWVTTRPIPREEWLAIDIRTPAGWQPVDLAQAMPG